jgi:hypothetical protein
VEREKATIGLLISFEKRTRQMREVAASAGNFETSLGEHPRIQLLTVAELLEGNRIDYPQTQGTNRTFKIAPQLKRLPSALPHFSTTPRMNDTKAPAIRRELVSRIIDSAKLAVDGVLDELKKQASDIAIDDNARFAMFADFAYLNFLWVGTVAFNALGSSTDSFMVSLHDEFIRDYGNLVINKEMPQTGRSIVQESLSDNLLSFQATFAEYPIRPSPAGSMKGSLFYEFGKVIAEEVASPNDMRVMMIATIQAAASVKSLDANSLVARLK